MLGGNQRFDACLAVKLHINPRFFAANDVRSDHTGNISFPGRVGSQEHVAAEGGALFVERDPMSAFRRSESGDHTGRAAAHHRYATGRLGCVDWLRFMPEARVCQASNGFALVHVRDASLQAGDARDQVVEAAVARFVR